VKLLVPYFGELRPADARLIRLAEFLGISCTSVSAEPHLGGGFSAPNAEGPGDYCLVVNPEVIRQCLAGADPSPDFVSKLLSRFRRFFIHSVRSDGFHAALVAALTGDCFSDVRQAQAPGSFKMPPESRDVCGAFAGLSIPVQNLASECVFSGAGAVGSRKFITLGTDAFFAAFKAGDTEVLLLGSGDVVNLDAEAGESWFTETFSSFIPYAMALRHIFGDECWRPVQSHACVVVDDPLLHPNYGFLNFEQLLQLTEKHNFETTIAFIPHNYRRNSQRIVRLFKENARRLSLCFHGNDHIGAEFATTDSTLLNTMLQIAQRRMTAFSQTTGLPCDHVMVFPQGKFSIDAMASLKSHNFDAAVNTGPRPYQQPLQLTLRELAEPAVLRYSGFPLFLRKYSKDTLDADIAFKLFFGIPILIVEHHNIFANPQTLLDAVDRINRAAPEIRWTGVGAAVNGSFLQRQGSSGPVQLRAFSRRIQVENRSSIPQQFHIEWACPGSKSSFDGVRRGDHYRADYTADENRISTSAVVDPGCIETFSIKNAQTNVSLAPMGLRYKTRAFIRRRLSEMRDNYVSKSPALLTTAESLRRCLQH
jgi:hypothetical protein